MSRSRLEETVGRSDDYRKERRMRRDDRREDFLKAAWGEREFVLLWQEGGRNN